MNIVGRTAHIEPNEFADWIADAAAGMAITYAQGPAFAWDASTSADLKSLRELVYRHAQAGRCFLFQRTHERPQDHPRDFEYVAVAAKVPPYLRPFSNALMVQPQ